jgi:hypothetical protein
MASFKSIMQAIGHDIKKAFDFIMPWAATTGAAAISVYAPQLGPLYNATVQAVLTAEAKWAAIGKSSGTGQQKLADVVQSIGPLISQGLIDAGKPGDDAAVQRYISSVVTVLNTAPGLPQLPPGAQVGATT